MRVAVCGGKDFLATYLIGSVLLRLHRDSHISELLIGNCRGVDAIVAEWAERTGIPVSYYNSDWLSYGADADDVRNQTLLAERPDIIVLFPGGKRTNDLLNKAIEAGHQNILRVDPARKKPARKKPARWYNNDKMASSQQVTDNQEKIGQTDDQQADDRARFESSDA